MNKETFLSIGFGNSVNSDRVVAVLAMPSAATLKMLNAAKEKNMAIDGTAGRKTRTVLVLDNGFVVTSGVNSTTIMARQNGEEE